MECEYTKNHKDKKCRKPKVNFNQPGKKGRRMIQTEKEPRQIILTEISWAPNSIWVNYNDLTVLPHWRSWFMLGKSSPFIAARFRLVNYQKFTQSYVCWFPNPMNTSFAFWNILTANVFFWNILTARWLLYPLPCISHQKNHVDNFVGFPSSSPLR